MLKIILPFAFCVPGSVVSAQVKTGSLSGTVLSAGKPVEGANIILLKLNDSSLVTIELTRKDGRFDKEKLKEGTFLFSASRVDLPPYEPVTVGSGHLALGNIDLAESDIKMSEVTVLAKRR